LITEIVFTRTKESNKKVSIITMWLHIKKTLLEWIQSLSLRIKVQLKKNSKF